MTEEKNNSINTQDGTAGEKYVLSVAVRNRIAVYGSREKLILGNSDYKVRFDFDGEWDSCPVRTARFRYRDEHGEWTVHNIIFEGTECTVPVLPMTETLYVGVYGGNIRTTTEAEIPCRPSALSFEGTPAAPLADVYSAIMEKLNQLELRTAEQKLRLSVADTLPTEKIDENTVYLVRTGDDVGDLYTEYLFVNGAWEILGCQRVDLTGYATEEWVNGCLGGYISDADLKIAVKLALAEAKKSGEFDGIPPHIGENGNWFIGETDTGVKASADDCGVLYTSQALTDSQKSTARGNINAAPPILAEAEGERIEVSDGADQPLAGASVFGKAWHGGEPDPYVIPPAPLQVLGRDGSFTLSVGENSMDAATPNGLPGIPVESGGNYVDGNGQEWISDEIDFGRGVYIRRIGHVAFGHGAEFSYNGMTQMFTASLDSFGAPRGKVLFNCLCNAFPATTVDPTFGNAPAPSIAVRGSMIMIRSFFPDNGAQLNAMFTEYYNNGTPAELLYVLDEPIETPLSHGQMTAFRSLSVGGNDCVITTDEGAWLAVKYAADTKKYVNTHGGFANVYNVKDYGAKGDGVSEDASAIRSAVLAAYEAGGGTVYLPKGEYVLKSPVLWETGVSLVGDGMGKSVLKTVSDEPVLGFSAIHYDSAKYGVNNRIKNCTFADFEIDGSGLQVSEVSWRGKGIFLIGVEDCVFRDICIRETAATGLGIDALKNVTVAGVMCIHCGRTWVKPANEENLGCAGIGIGTNMMDDEYFTITGCMTKGCGNMGIFLEDQTLRKPMYRQYSVIANNIVLDGMNVGIGIRGTQYMHISDNIVRGNVCGIEFSRENKNILLSNNLISENRCGIYDNSVSADTVDIVGNTVSDNEIAGVCYTNTTTLGSGTKQKILLKDNHIKNNGVGIRITGEIRDLAILSNFITENAGIGMIADAGASLPDGYVLYNIFRKNGENVNGVPNALSGDSGYDIARPARTGISLGADVALAAGSQYKLSAVPVPADAVIDGSVVWHSDNPSVATVENGVVSCLTEGNCIITATVGEHSAQCEITVTAAGNGSPHSVNLGEDGWDNGYYTDGGAWVDDSTGTHYTTHEFYPTDGYAGLYVNQAGVLLTFDSEKGMKTKHIAADGASHTACCIADGDAYAKFKTSGDKSNAVLTFIANEITVSKIKNGTYVNASGAEANSSDQAVTEERFPVSAGGKYFLGLPDDGFNNKATLRVYEYAGDGGLTNRQLNLACSGAVVELGANTAFVRIGFSALNGEGAAITEEQLASAKNRTVFGRIV